MLSLFQAHQETLNSFYTTLSTAIDPNISFRHRRQSKACWKTRGHATPPKLFKPTDKNFSSQRCDTKTSYFGLIAAFSNIEYCLACLIKWALKLKFAAVCFFYCTNSRKSRDCWVIEMELYPDTDIRDFAIRQDLDLCTIIREIFYRKPAWSTEVQYFTTAYSTLPFWEMIGDVSVESKHRAIRLVTDRICRSLKIESLDLLKPKSIGLGKSWVQQMRLLTLWHCNNNTMKSRSWWRFVTG